MSEFSPVLKLSSLNGSNGFSLVGAAAGNHTGTSVHSAGDVNGDGFDDVIVGAPYNGLGDAGASYVVFGKAGGFGASINLSALNGTNGFRLDGVAGDDLTGRSVSAAGDINGDGFADVIVGAPGADTNGPYSGASYVVFGHAGGFTPAVALSALNGTNGFRIDGAAANDNSGLAVSSAGDVNGDGFDDLIIGAPDGFAGLAGSSFVVFGKAGGFGSSMSLSTLNGSNGFRIDGIFSGDAFGASVHSAGDVNGDGFDDVIVGAPNATPGGPLSGASYVIFGHAGGFDAAINVATLDGVNGFRVDGLTSNGRAGYSVSAAGDINGDGFGDLVVGVFGDDRLGLYSGTAYVVFGRSAFAQDVDVSALDGSNGFRLDGVRALDAAGWSVADAGDVNGDGFADVLISAKNFSVPGAHAAGAAFVVFGHAGGFAPVVDLGALNGNNGFRIDGVATYDATGFSVSAAGDVNGDGFDDLIVGASQAGPNGPYSGAAYVVFGHRPQSAVDIAGTDFDNHINGGIGDDTLSGLSGNDTLTGWEGDDTINGGDGNDTIDGGAGSDHLFGGSGADTFFASLGDDTINGGSGSDIINFQHISGGGVSVNLATGAVTLPDADSSIAIAQIERLSGTAAADSFTGDGHNNQLFGRDGADVLSGGAGNDRLVGGLGSDKLTGGTGADTFEFDAIGETTANALRDTIMDFVSTEGDKINLGVIDSNTTARGNQAFAFIGTAAYSGPGQVRYTVADGSATVHGDVNGDGVDDFQILVNGVTVLNVSDFIL